MSARRPRDRTAAGFTLIELLVAITLLGLLMAALFGGLRLGARAWEAGQSRVETSARLQVVQQFVRTRLEEAVPVRLIDERGDERVAFRGEPGRVSFVGTAPDALGGGLYQFTLGLRDDMDGRPGLSLAWRRFETDAEGVQIPSEVLGRRDLLADVAGLTFAYYGATVDDPEPTWRESWEEAEGLPVVVRLAIAYPEGDPRSWPELLARPMIDQPPGGVF